MRMVKALLRMAMAASVTAAAVPAAAAVSAGPVVLYDAALNSLPQAQGWAGPVGPAAVGVAGGVLTFDTTFANAVQAGFFRSDQLLGSTTGFRVGLTAQVLSESHANNDRAGFSLIVLDSAHRGVELGFWADSIFALNAPTQLNPGLFTHAESSAPGFRPAAAMTSNSLQLRNGAYTLSAGNATILSGAMRDYSASVQPVYSTNNFMFFGDDTSSARAAVNIGLVSVSAVPEPGMLGLMLAGLCLVGLAVRRAGAKD